MAGLNGWIDAEKQMPKLIDGKDYSANVWGWDGNEIMVVSWCLEPGDGWFWANAYGNIWGANECDADYDIKYWQPIAIPKPPINPIGDRDE